MNKLILLVLAVLAIAALSSASEEENSLSEDLASSRVARSPEAGRKRRKGKRGNKSKKSRPGRKRSKKSKRRNPKPSKKSRKSPKKAAKKSISKKNNNRQSSSTVSTDCLSMSIKMMKMWKDIVRNFEAQYKRIKKQNSTGDNKAGKKGLFAPIARRLVEIGGGNKSDLSCGGEKDNDGAKQLANLTETLFKCEIEVNTSCNTANFHKPNMTLINKCESLVETFKTAATDCLNKTMMSNFDEACSCWTNSNLTAVAEEFKTCKVADDAQKVTAQLRKCTKAFGKCRKFEDDAITSIMSCKENKDKLKEKGSALQKNKNKVEEAKAKLASLTAERDYARQRRQAGTCTEIITFSKKMTTIILQFPSSPQVIVVAEEIIKSSVTVCTTEEISMIEEEVSSMDEALEEIEEALEAVQEQIEALTGSTASPTELETFSTTTAGSESSMTEGSTMKEEATTTGYYDHQPSTTMGGSTMKEEATTMGSGSTMEEATTMGSGSSTMMEETTTMMEDTTTMAMSTQAPAGRLRRFLMDQRF